MPRVDDAAPRPRRSPKTLAPRPCSPRPQADAFAARQGRWHLRHRALGAAAAARQADLLAASATWVRRDALDARIAAALSNPVPLF